MSETTRPKRVVVLDADNPMSEVHGEFFWLEDHEELLAQTRETALRDGYERGFQQGYQRGLAAAADAPPMRVILRRRVSLMRLVVPGCLAFLVVGFLMLLAGILH